MLLLAYSHDVIANTLRFRETRVEEALREETEFIFDSLLDVVYQYVFDRSIYINVSSLPQLK